MLAIDPWPDEISPGDQARIRRKRAFAKSVAGHICCCAAGLSSSVRDETRSDLLSISLVEAAHFGEGKVVGTPGSRSNARTAFMTGVEKKLELNERR